MPDKGQDLFMWRERYIRMKQYHKTKVWVLSRDRKRNKQQI